MYHAQALSLGRFQSEGMKESRNGACVVVVREIQCGAYPRLDIYIYML